MQKTFDLKSTEHASRPRVTPRVNMNYHSTPTTKKKLAWGKIALLELVAALVLSLGFFFVTSTKPTVYTFRSLFLTRALDYQEKIETLEFSFSDTIPTELQTTIRETLEKVVINGTDRYSYNAESSNVIALTLASKDEEVLSEPYSYLVPVGHFYWIRKDATWDDLSDSTVYIKKDNDLIKTLLDENNISYQEEEDLLATLEDSDENFALIDINDLSFEYKLLDFEGEYFLDDKPKGAIAYYYSINADISDSLQDSFEAQLSYATSGDSATEKTDHDYFTINQTGVTAISRALTSKVISSGKGNYPAQNIGEFLADADLTHVSNEISFVPGCTATSGMSFCALPQTIEALQDSGVDIVELTGNHNNDYGRTYNTDTINKYIELGWDYFGGGLNDADASEILYKEINGSTVAFLGYNYYNSYYEIYGALATDDTAGANIYTAEKVDTDIKKAVEKADFVIVDFQFQECYSYPDYGAYMPSCYRSNTVANQETVFKAAIDSGADMVVGTQAHQPQTYEIYNGKPIFYGLGNLYFDQIYWPGTQHGLVLTHYFDNGKYVQTKMTTTNYGRDMITYVSEGEERELLLEFLKDARD